MNVLKDGATSALVKRRSAFRTTLPFRHRSRHDGGGRGGEGQLEEEGDEDRPHVLALRVHEPSFFVSVRRQDPRGLCGLQGPES